MTLDQVVSELVERIRQDRGLMRGGEPLRQALARYSGFEPAVIAAKAHEVSRAHMSRNGDLDLAQGAALVANAVYLEFGDQPNSLRAAYDFGQIRFAIANDLEAYLSQRRSMAQLVSAGAQQGMHDLAFNAALAMADCTYFAIDCANEREQVDALMRQALADVLVACEALALGNYRDEMSPAVAERFVSLAANVFTRLSNRIGSLPSPFFAGDAGGFDAETATALRTLAGLLEQWIPPEFKFANNPNKSQQCARMLADLSMRFGDAEKARQRLMIAVLDDE